MYQKILGTAIRKQSAHIKRLEILIRILEAENAELWIANDYESIDESINTQVGSI